MNNLKKIPRFKSEDEEREFWANHDSTEYFHIFKPIKLNFPNLKPSTRTITIRLPESLLMSLRTFANKKDVPYQSLMKVYLAEKVQEELNAIK